MADASVFLRVVVARIRLAGRNVVDVPGSGQPANTADFDDARDVAALPVAKGDLLSFGFRNSFD